MFILKGLMTLIVVFLCFLLSPALLRRTTIAQNVLTCSSMNDASTSPSSSWKNPKYEEEQLRIWWNQIDRPLISVGSKGVQPSHIRSLSEILESHVRVKVKLVSDKLDSKSIATKFMDDQLLVNGTLS